LSGRSVFLWAFLLGTFAALMFVLFQGNPAMQSSTADSPAIGDQEAAPQ